MSNPVSEFVHDNWEYCLLVVALAVVVGLFVSAILTVYAVSLLTCLLMLFCGGIGVVSH